MKVMISGHRKQKLLNYDCDWIRGEIKDKLLELKAENGFVKGYSGMASGIDLWFCEICKELDIPYVACIPFEEQLHYDERKETWKMRQEIVVTRNITQSAIGHKNGLWTAVTASAVFVE